jgi:hypothetical protein
MSLRWRDRRRELFGRREKRSAAPGELRRDFAAPPRGTRARLAWTPLVALAVVCLLALAALRISILRTRYTLGATLQRETELRSRERALMLEVRQGRDPHKLRETATQLGFARPGRVIDLGREARGR